MYIVCKICGASLANRVRCFELLDQAHYLVTEWYAGYEVVLHGGRGLRVL